MNDLIHWVSPTARILAPCIAIGAVNVVKLIWTTLTGRITLS